jgi:hypothetical protein
MPRPASSAKVDQARGEFRNTATSPNHSPALITPEMSASGVGSSKIHPAWLQTNSIIDSIAKSLFAAQVAFCRLDRNVAEQELNLLQFTASLMA